MFWSRSALNLLQLWRKAAFRGQSAITIPHGRGHVQQGAPLPMSTPLSATLIQWRKTRTPCAQRACWERGAKVLVWCCERVAPLVIPCTTVVHPLYNRCTTVVQPLYIPCGDPAVSVPQPPCPVTEYQTRRTPRRLHFTSRASVFQRQVLGPEPRLELAEAKPAGLVFAHIVHIGLGWDFLFEPDGPIGGIDQEPAQALVLQVHRRAHSGREDLRGLAALARVIALAR